MTATLSLASGPDRRRYPPRSSSARRKHIPVSSIAMWHPTNPGDEQLKVRHQKARAQQCRTPFSPRAVHKNVSDCIPFTPFIWCLLTIFLPHLGPHRSFSLPSPPSLPTSFAAEWGAAFVWLKSRVLLLLLPLSLRVLEEITFSLLLLLLPLLLLRFPIQTLFPSSIHNRE